MRIFYDFFWLSFVLISHSVLVIASSRDLYFHSFTRHDEVWSIVSNLKGSGSSGQNSKDKGKKPLQAFSVDKDCFIAWLISLIISPVDMGANGR